LDEGSDIWEGLSQGASAVQERAMRERDFLPQRSKAKSSDVLVVFID
jgi:hypothetical protein